MRGRDPRKGNLKTADKMALYPFDGREGSPFALEQKGQEFSNFGNGK